MLDYLPSKLYSFINIISLILATIIFLKNTQNKKIAQFLSFIFYVVIVEEILGKYVMYLYNQNSIVYNFHSVGCLGWYIYLLLGFSINQSKFSRTCLLFLIGTWVSYVIYQFLSKDIYSFIIIENYLFGYLIVIFTCGLLLKQILEMRINPFSICEFYLLLGICIFFVCIFPSLIFINDIFSIEGKIDDMVLNNAKKASMHIFDSGNIILSLGYLGMIICSWKKI